MTAFFDAQIVLDSYGWLITALLGGVGVGWVWRIVQRMYEGWTSF